MLLWPYDELKLSQGQASSEFFVQTPWFSVSLKVADSDQPRVAALASKIQTGTLSPDDRFELSWLFKPLAQFPLAYILPRPESAFLDTDVHLVHSSKIPNLGTTRPWTWDLEATLQFSKTGDGHDPFSILSVARRFHFLDLLEGNPLGEAIKLIETMTGEPERHRQANALIVRQNHYVTTRCDASLAPALGISQRAEPAVRGFMDAERGHDKLLEKALRSLAPNPDAIAALPAAIELMDLLRLSATRNLLGFALAVDIFERASYTEQDPLATFLSSGGYTQAAKQIDVHRKINDSGAHENVSLGILEPMGIVDRAYATEAFRLGESVSKAILDLSVQILEAVRKI